MARTVPATWATDVLGSGRAFHLEVRKGAGSYVCGEETALLESLEGKRGIVRAKPPLPAIQGLFGKPTLINNVITLATVPVILARGSAFYRDYGMGRSRGTLPMQLAGNIGHGGLVEKAFGVTLRELLFDFGGGTASGRPMKAVQVGGPLGAYLPGIAVGHAARLRVVRRRSARRSGTAASSRTTTAPTSGEAGALRDGILRHRIVRQVHPVPHRLHARRRGDRQDRRTTRTGRSRSTLLRDLCDTMINGSLCAMGGMTPFPVLSALNHFPQDFGLAATVRARAGLNDTS